MGDDDLVELKCKFCGGPLRLEEPRDTTRGVPFRFYRCVKCDMPNVTPERKREK